MSFHFFKEQSGEIGQEQFVEHLSVMRRYAGHRFRGFTYLVITLQYN